MKLDPQDNSLSAPFIFVCELFSVHFREMVNSWFAERVHSIQPSREVSKTLTDGSKTLLEASALTAPGSRETSSPSPVPSTPTRKISASEFDRPLRPIVVKDAEGALTFLGDADPVPMPPPTPTHKLERTGGDRCARLLELVRDVSSHLDLTALCHRIFLHTHELIAADRYSLFLVCEDSSNRKFLVSRLFDVAEGSTLEEASNSGIRLEWNKGIVGHVAATGQPLNIKNAYEVRPLRKFDMKSFLSHIRASENFLHYNSCTTISVR